MMKPKHTLSSVTVVAATAALLLGSGQDTASRPRKVKPVTVFLLRHAEAGDRSKTNDPGLTAAGELRAKALRRLLGNAGVTHLFATEYKRTQQTLMPLARLTSLKVKVVSSRQRKEQLAALGSLPPGSVAVVAGHSNTVPQLVRGLGGKATNLSTRGLIPNDAFDRLLLVTLPTAKPVEAQTIELRFGTPGRGG